MTRDASGDAEETMEIRCPECKKRVKVAVADVEKGKKVTCPEGHEIPLAQAL